MKKVRGFLPALGLFWFLQGCVLAEGPGDRAAGHFGVEMGAPTGLAVDVQVDRSNRLFSDLGVWSGDLAMNAGWAHQFPGLVKPKDARLALDSYLGAAVHARFDDKTRLGLGIVLGQEITVDNSPFRFFVRLIPLVRISPSAGFNLSAVMGATFSF
ncbi:MAG: hypothetical protein AAB091_01555 [Elusimicrobiota bacterium]